MKRLAVLWLIIFCLFFNHSFGLEAEENSGQPKITLYLKSGEILRGDLLDKTEDKIIIKKYESTLEVAVDELIRVEEEGSGKSLTAGYKLPFSTAIIVYEYKGWQKGKETVYIDTIKNKVAREISTQTDYAGVSYKNDQTMIYDGEAFYIVDNSRKEALKMEKQGEMVSEMFGEQLYFGNPVIQGSVLGKDCNVYIHPAGRAYYWKGILLKEEMLNHPMGEDWNFFKEAREIKLDVPIASDKFKLAEGIQVKSMQDLWKSLDTSGEETEGSYAVWKENYQKQYKQNLEESAKNNPQLQKILEESLLEDGSIDIEKAQNLIMEKDKEDLIKKAKKFKDGEQLIKQATGEDGTIDTYQLNNLVYQKQWELHSKAKKLLEAARLYQQQEKYVEALAKYNEAIEANPTDSYPYYLRAQLYQFMGKDKEALKDLTLLIEELNQNSYLNDRADIYLRLNKYQEAIDDYTKSLEMAKERLAKRREEEKELLTEIGESKADKDLLKAEDYAVVGVLKERGRAYYKIGQYQKAISDFNQALQQTQSKWLKGDLYFLRGLAYRQMNEKEKMTADWQKADSLGDKLVEGNYLAGKRQGRFIWYYPDGSLRTEGFYQDGQEQGKFIWYYPSGIIKTKGGYLNGQRQGEYFHYYNNGNLQSRKNYQAGKLAGVCQYYDRVQGYLFREETYVNDKLEGEARWYYDNGGLMEKSMFKNGLRNGQHYKYYENGQIQQEGLFADGLENGTMTLYNSDGSFKKKIIFEQGKRIKDIYQQ